MKPRHAAIVVEQSSCWCSACGKNVNPEQDNHVDITGYVPKPGGGCGAKFVAITSGNWAYGPEDLAYVRSDLPAIPADILRFNTVEEEN